MCEHDGEMAEEYADFQYEEGFCGNTGAHAPHADCLGIMCDYGCNAEDF